MTLKINNNCLVGADTYSVNYYIYNCAAPEIKFNVNRDIAIGSTEFEVKDEIKASTKTIKKSGRDYSSKRITGLERIIGLSMTTNESALPFIDFMEQIVNSEGACDKLSGKWGYICEKIAPNGKRVYTEFMNGTIEPKNGGTGLNKDSETEYEIEFTRSDDPKMVIYYSIGQVFIPSEYEVPVAKFTTTYDEATKTLTIGEFTLTDESGFAPAEIIFNLYDEKGVTLKTKVVPLTELASVKKTVAIECDTKPKYTQAAFEYAPGTTNISSLCPIGLVELK